MLVLLLGLLTAAILFYRYIKRWRYWSNRGVPQLKPKWIFGDFWENLIGRRNGCDVVHSIYKQIPDARYIGMYRFSNPLLLVRDPELIKKITVKDFDSFTDHVDLLPADVDRLWSKNLLNLTGTKWKEMRAHLSPSFTSAKMRTIYMLMTECAENLLQHLLEKDQELLTLEMRDVFSRYTNDVIATTAFGVKVDSLAKPDNEFYKMANDVADIGSFRKTMRILLYSCIPAIKRIMKIRLITDEVGKFFRGIIDDTIKTREEKGIVRPDMLHLLLQTRKYLQKQNEQGSIGHEKQSIGTDKEVEDLTNEDITAHALIFIIGGFESVASFISYATYELAVNPEAQKKLREEIRATLEQYDGKVSYEAILDMKYMDMVANETLRKWPSFVSINRVCTKPYTIEPVGPEEKPVRLEKGAELIIPAYALQHDPKYFPDPERFDPERFSDENKANITPYTYFPFGLGPRNCIGSRFAILEAKIVLFNLLSQFEIVPVEKTTIPIKLVKTTIINLKPEGGLWE